MSEPRRIKIKRELTITFSRDPAMDYCWSLNGEPKPGMSIFAAGHTSMLDLLQSSEFLIAVSKVLGKDSLPPSYVDNVKATEQTKRLKITDDQVATIKAMFPGVPFKDKRKKSIKS